MWQESHDKLLHHCCPVYFPHLTPASCWNLTSSIDISCKASLQQQEMMQETCFNDIHVCVSCRDKKKIKICVYYVREFSKKNVGMIISLGKGERRNIIKVFIFSNSVYLWNFINNQKLFCRTYYSFLWCLLGGQLCQDETEYHLPRQQLLEIHWSR